MFIMLPGSWSERLRIFLLVAAHRAPERVLFSIGRMLDLQRTFSRPWTLGQLVFAFA